MGKVHCVPTPGFMYKDFNYVIFYQPEKKIAENYKLSENIYTSEFHVKHIYELDDCLKVYLNLYFSINKNWKHLNKV